MKAIGRKMSLIEKMIVILVIFMPTHRMLFDAIIPGNIDNLWRDILILLSLVLALLRTHGRLNIGQYGSVIILAIAICMLYTIVSDRFFMSLNLARTYIVPMLIYFVMINIKTNDGFLERLERIFVYEGVLLSIFGIFQAFVLGDSFLVNLGYASKGEHLASNSFYISHFYGIQRVTATFASPNICGVYFGMVIIVLSGMMKKIKNSSLFMGILAAGLITTFSRSAILGTVFALLLLNFRSVKRIKISKKFLALPVIVAVGVILDHIILDGVIMDMLASSVSSTINLTDSSANKHLSDLWEPMAVILTNPLGLGFGHNGPIVKASYSDANLVESSVYLLAYNFGILGAIFFLFPYVQEAWNMMKERRFCRISGAICIMALVTYLLLPNVETYEIIYFIFFFIGLVEKKHLLSKGGVRNMQGEFLCQSITK